jgi:hypothetical protein
LFSGRASMTEMERESKRLEKMKDAALKSGDNDKATKIQKMIDIINE